MRISDWSSDVCSSDLLVSAGQVADGCKVRIAAFGPLSVNLVQTSLGSVSLKLLAKTETVIRQRVERLGGHLKHVWICDQIGRASGRERVWKYVEISGGGVY